MEIIEKFKKKMEVKRPNLIIFENIMLCMRVTDSLIGITIIVLITGKTDNIEI